MNDEDNQGMDSSSVVFTYQDGKAKKRWRFRFRKNSRLRPDSGPLDPGVLKAVGHLAALLLFVLQCSVDPRSDGNGAVVRVTSDLVRNLLWF